MGPRAGGQRSEVGSPVLFVERQGEVLANLSGSLRKHALRLARNFAHESHECHEWGRGGKIGAIRAIRGQPLQAATSGSVFDGDCQSAL